jgi:hypothetical protein
VKKVQVFVEGSLKEREHEAGGETKDPGGQFAAGPRIELAASEQAHGKIPPV